MKFLSAIYLCICTIGIVIAFKNIETSSNPFGRMCPTTSKCGTKSNGYEILTHDGCRCRLFKDTCDMGHYNVDYQPEFQVVSDRFKSRCDCYATNDWIANPRSKRCNYDKMVQTNDECSEAQLDCQNSKGGKVTGFNQCECKIFDNECYMRKFNCNYVQGFKEIAEEQCACNYRRREKHPNDETE